MGNLDFFINLFKNQSIGMNQIYCILTLPILCQKMTSSNSIFYHHLNGIGCCDFIDTLMDLSGHVCTISFFR